MIGNVMRKLIVFLAILMLGTGLTLAKEIKFAENYETALKIAAEKDQQVLITFYADW